MRHGIFIRLSSRGATAIVICSLVAGCGAAPDGSQLSASLTASPLLTSSSGASTNAGGSRFTSAVYDYSIAVPPGWSAAAASQRWDGTSQPGSDEPTNDRFISGGSASAWVRAAPVSVDLAAYTAATIAGNAEFHGDTCGTEPPDAIESVRVGGEMGSLLAWDCGILINVGITVHKGAGYFFGLRDPGVHGATDPVDHDLFVTMLGSVSFAD